MKRAALSLAFALTAGCSGALSVQARAFGDARPQLGCVAVLPFADLSGSGYGVIVSHEIAAALMASAPHILAPAEAEDLLRRARLPTAAPANAVVAQRYADLMGADAVLWGVVSELREGGGALPRGTVGFVAHLTDARSGRLVWATTTVHVAHGILWRTIMPRDVLLRSAAQVTADELRAAATFVEPGCKDALGGFLSGQVDGKKLAVLEQALATLGIKPVPETATSGP